MNDLSIFIENKRLFSGDEKTMSVIFFNISGRNFDSSTRYRTYLNDLTHLISEHSAGAPFLFYDGDTVTLRTPDGATVHSHTFRFPLPDSVGSPCSI